MRAKPRTLGDVPDADTMEPDQLGMSIRMYRRQAGMTQRCLAQTAGCSQAYISQLEDGRSREPSVYIIQRLARIFGMSIDDLIRRR